MPEEDQYFETGSEVEESFDTQPQEDDQAPQQNPTDNSDTPSKSLYSAPRSFFGGNFDVYSALETVVFQGAAGDASLRGNVAYIRVWKRGGTAQQTQSSALAPSILDGQDEQKRLEDDLEAAIGNRDNVANNYDPRIGEYDYNPYGDDVDNPIEVAEANIQIAENALQRQQSLRAQTPTSTPLDPNNTNTWPLPPPLPPLPKTDGAVGAVKSANPNGAINLFAKAGRAIVGIPQGKPEYSGGANTGSTLVGSATPPSGEMMWQFLFNPSELEIEAGPEFKNAETWGVSDKGNSGQPLHWSHNKNAQLKFNSILLNGYVFGRKVEKLEQGLIELFMARDGEGQHGPHVLEFVWGKRVFGPCVIKNVNIKEKMWDEGEVVNAEVSFTLEQVPEWTINDGFVDVARPGRQQLATNPVPGAAGAAGAAGATGAADAGGTDPGDGKNQDQKSQDPAGGDTSGSKLCNWNLEISKQFQQLYVKVNNPLTAGAFGNPSSIISSFYSAKSSLYAGSSEIGNFVDSKVSSGCKKSSYRATTSDILKSGGNFAISSQQQALQFVRACTETTKKALDDWHRESPKCKTQREAGAKGRVEQKQKDLCAKYTGRCDRPGERFGTAGQCPFVNNNRGVKCSGGVWTPI